VEILDKLGSVGVVEVVCEVRALHNGVSDVDRVDYLFCELQRHGISSELIYFEEILICFLSIEPIYRVFAFEHLVDNLIDKLFVDCHSAVAEEESVFDAVVELYTGHYGFVLAYLVFGELFEPFAETDKHSLDIGFGSIFGRKHSDERSTVGYPECKVDRIQLIF